MRLAKLVEFESIITAPFYYSFSLNMENTAAYRSEQRYLEKWYVLEDRLKHYIDDIVRFTPTITYDGRRQAAEELARLISLVEHVKVNGLQLAAEFPDCITIREQPSSYFDGDYRLMCELMKDTLADAVADLEFPLKDSLTIRSLKTLLSHVCKHNAC